MARRALLIANGLFDDEGVTRLQSPVSDLKQVGELLARGAVGSYIVTTCYDFESRAVRRTLERFFEDAEVEDLLFVMLSGHGIKDRDGKFHFAMRDSELSAIRSTSLDAEFLHTLMDGSLADQKILVLDTCYSGAFAKGHVSKGLSVTRDEFGNEASKGKIVITASTAVQASFEAASGDFVRSRFTHHFIEGIGSGGAVQGDGGEITVEGLYTYITRKLRSEYAADPTLPRQSPQRWYFGLEGTVVLAYDPTPKPIQLSIDLIDRLSSAIPSIRASTVDDLAGFVLTSHPLGELAMSKLVELEDDDSFHVAAAAGLALKKLAKKMDPGARKIGVEALTEAPNPIPSRPAAQFVHGDPITSYAIDPASRGGSRIAGWLFDKRLRLGAIVALAIVVLGSWALWKGLVHPVSPSIAIIASKPVAPNRDAHGGRTSVFSPAPVKAKAARVSAPPRTTAMTKFDCVKAAMPLDWAICADSGAEALNDRMAGLWESTRQALPQSSRRAFVDEQLAWILATQHKCGLPESGHPADAVVAASAACVHNRYEERIRQLSNAALVPGNFTPPPGIPWVVSAGDAILGARPTAAGTTFFHDASAFENDGLPALDKRRDWAVQVLACSAGAARLEEVDTLVRSDLHFPTWPSGRVLGYYKASTVLYQTKGMEAGADALAEAIGAKTGLEIGSWYRPAIHGVATKSGAKAFYVVLVEGSSRCAKVR